MEEPPALREDLIKTAVKFLQSDQVQSTSYELKKNFLKKKGLTEEEIDASFSRANVFLGKSNAVAQLPPPPLPPLLNLHSLPLETRWTRFRDIANTIAVFGALGYGMYWLYKTYAVPYLWGESKKKSVERRLSELNDALTNYSIEVRSNISRIREDLDKIAGNCGRTDQFVKQIEDLKSEVTSLKKLMLNRKQFPQASVTTPLSIPAWQISERPPEEKETEALSEEGNGSGTNGSDSSLEMIKE